MKSELMLFGVASLLLNVLETPITSICSKSLHYNLACLPARQHFSSQAVQSD